MSERGSTEERLERVEQAIAQIHTENRVRISRNSFRIALLRVTLISVLGGVGLVAALLSAAEYETKIGKDTALSFHGSEFKGALQVLAGFAATGTGVLGFGDRFLKKEKET